MRPDWMGAAAIVGVLAVLEVTLLLLGVHSFGVLVAAFVAWLGGGAVVLLAQRVRLRRER